MPESDSSTWVVGRWLGRVVNGWLNDYAVPGRGRFIRGFPAADSASCPSRWSTPPSDRSAPLSSCRPDGSGGAHIEYWTSRGYGRRGLVPLKSMPCGKPLFFPSKQHITTVFHSFVGTAVGSHRRFPACLSLYMSFPLHQALLGAIIRHRNLPDTRVESRITPSVNPTYAATSRLRLASHAPRR